MHKPFLSLLALFSLLATTSVQAANAPSSIVGKKIVLSIPDGSKTYGITLLGTSENQSWELEHENGDWEKSGYRWTANGSGATFVEVPHFSGGAYVEVSFSFSSDASGNFTYKDYEPNSSGVMELDEQGSGTFTINNYSSSELPSFDNYFSDDFSSSQSSANYWYENTEITSYGLSLNQTNGRLELLGTGNDPEERWFEVNAKSLLSTNKDWIIQGDLFATFQNTGNEWWTSKIGFEVEDSGLDFDLFIGASSWGVHAHLNYEDSSGENIHLFNVSDSSVREGTFRVLNDSAAETFTTEYLSAGSWKRFISVNWKTGALSGAYSHTGSVSQLSNWVSLESKYVQPGLDFMIPHIDNGNDSIDIKNLSSNELGVSSFSVIEGAPVSAPSSLVGKKIRISFVETANDAEGVHEFYFAGNGKGWMRYWLESNDPSDETYWDDDNFTYQISGENSALLKLGTNEDYSEIPLTFTSENAGSFTAQGWKMENGSLVQTGPMNATGSFTLSDYDESELPASQGWLWFDQYPWVYCDEEKNWLYFLPSNGKINIYSVRDKAWREMTKTE